MYLLAAESKFDKGLVPRETATVYSRKIAGKYCNPVSIFLCLIRKKGKNFIFYKMERFNDNTNPTQIHKSRMQDRISAMNPVSDKSRKATRFQTLLSEVGYSVVRIMAAEGVYL